MSDRDIQATTTLLRSLLDWAPGPHGARWREQAHVGFAHVPRELTCADCLANGYPYRWPQCETCGGTGRVASDLARDPMELPAVTRFFGEDKQRQRDRAHQRDRQIERIQALLAGETGDQITHMLEARDRLYAAGDYAELDRWLEAMSLTAPALHHAVWVCYVLPELAERDVGAGLLAWANRGVAALALCMGKPIRVPPWLRSERQAEASKASLAWGRSLGHKQQRGQRNAMIRAMGETLTAGQIARQTGLTKRRVQQILATESAAQASGPAA